MGSEREKVCLLDARESLEQVYRRIGRGLFQQALAIVTDPTTAEDLVQESFVRMLDRREALGRVEDMDCYLYRTVRNLALNCLRRRRTTTRVQSKLKAGALLVTEDADPGQAEEAERLSRAVAELPLEQREVVVLRVYGGLSFREIAERTVTPQGTVHSRFRYGLERLRRWLQEDKP